MFRIARYQQSAVWIFTHVTKIDGFRVRLVAR